VKILDFGLARQEPGAAAGAESALATVTATEPGTVMGTATYMSPEQVRGLPVDARSDIFSFGSVLYEMVTGRRAFPGKTAADSMAAILKDSPPDPSESGKTIPLALGRVITRCLEKAPDERFQSARDLTYALREIASATGSAVQMSGVAKTQPAGHGGRVAAIAVGVIVLGAALIVAFDVGGLRKRLTGAAKGTAIRSLAVLPLQNLSGDASQEIFADGMTEELITSLARIEGLGVTSRTSVMTFKGTKKTLPQIARELGVDAIVEGSVSRAEGKIHVTAQLIEANSDKHLWGQTYERDLHDVLAVEGEIAQGIAKVVRGELTPQEQARLGTSRRIPPDAHDAYVRGRYFYNQREWGKAVEQFQAALNSEPTYAAAYAGLAAAYALQGYQNELSPRDSFPKAKAAALKALDLETGLAEAHAVLGYVHMYFDWDFPAAEAEFKRAIAANPNSEQAHHFYSIFLTALLRPAEARVQIERARELDPLSGFVASDMGFELYYDRKYDEAEKQLKEALAMNPKSFARFWLGRTYQAQKNYEAAVPAYEAVGELGALGHLYAIQGKRAEAEKVLARLATMAREAPSKGTYVTPYDATLVYLGLGDRDKTIEWLNKCVDERTNWLVWLWRDPRWDPMRSDPRFTEILRRVGFPLSA
jgi:TolB-like protein/Tfp pilus assembly protein PilF